MPRFRQLVVADFERKRVCNILKLSLVIGQQPWDLSSPSSLDDSLALGAKSQSFRRSFVGLPLRTVRSWGGTGSEPGPDDGPGRKRPPHDGDRVLVLRGAKLARISADGGEGHQSKDD